MLQARRRNQLATDLAFAWPTTVMNRFVFSALFFLLLISPSLGHSADIVFVASRQGSDIEQKQLEAATAFYGLGLKVTVVNSLEDRAALRKLIEREETVGVAIAASSLTFVKRNDLLRSSYGQKKTLPIMILGVTPDTDLSSLREWSGGTITGARYLGNLSRPEYVFGRVDGLTSQLSDLKVPLHAPDLSVLALGEQSPAVLPLLSVRKDDETFPVFIEYAVTHKLFVAAAMPSDELSKDEIGVVGAFVRLAPALMFVRYCGGNKAWHAVQHYANLTIDDPWLRQPYGFVDYISLLEQMERHNFHTTIAFIPWNYDRSQANVVSLFREHRDRFSITIHGDNHDHKEFADYKSKPFPVQVADLKQSLARMEKFRSLTGIDYDRVMIFPHSIPPRETLAALKTFNYLATVNSTNVPQGDAAPSSSSFYLRPVTLLFAGFTSVSRYSISNAIPKAFLAINEYLDNPLFFYGHSDDFAKGIDAFNETADEVNRLEPDTQWLSLGEILKHFYLVKLRDDSNFDVLTFSNHICLDNRNQSNLTFYVQKEETGPQIIDSVQLEGHSYPFQLESGSFRTEITVPARATRCLAIQYKNDLQLASIGTSDHSVVVYFLRLASDFRDIYLSKSTEGLAFVRFYNQHQLTPARLIEILLFLMALCTYAAYRFRELARTRRPS